MLKSMFTYGTLMCGNRNYMKYLYKKVVSIEPAYIKGKLFHLHDYNCPGLIEGNEDVYGEYITYIDNENDDVEKAVDNLENVFHPKEPLHYTKEKKVIKVNNKDINTYCYICQNIESHNKQHVLSGSWREFKNL